MGLLVLAHVVMAFNEPLKDALFFSRVKPSEEEYYPLFNRYADIGSLIGRVSCAVFLLFFPTRVSFLVIAVLMAIMGVLSSKI